MAAPFDYNAGTASSRIHPVFFMFSLRFKPLSLCLLLLTMTLTLSGCGQKGQLYIEGHEPPSQRAVAKKRRAEQAKQAEEALKAQQSGLPRQEAPDTSDKDNMPELAPSAPN